MSGGTPPTVCVLGEDERAFLSVVRSFGRRGAVVHCCWTSPTSLARRSRYVACVHDDVPPFAPHDLAWRDGLVDLFRRHRFDLVLPVNDVSVVPLQAHRASLEPHARLYLLSDRAFAVVSDKAATHALARELDVPVPRQVEVGAGVAAEVDASWFPVVVKPRASFTGAEATRRVGVVHVDRPALLPAALARVGGDALVQEFIPGGGVGVEVLACDGHVLTAFQHARVHELRRDGADSYRVSEPVDPVLGAATERLVAALGYTGVGMFEFRRDPASGRWALLEINGRFWGSLPLCLRAGADFPWWLYEMLAHGRRDFPRSYRTGVACRNWSRDLLWLRNELASPAGRRRLPRRLGAELGRLLMGREGSDTLVRDDRGPGIEEMRRLAGRAVGWMRRGASRLLERVPPVRRRHATRTRDALRLGGGVLFVCKGNICRSPFAERYVRLRYPGLRAVLSSAGYHPKGDRPSPPAAVEAARELGVDLGAHRSRVLDAEMVRNADVIVTFDRENHDVVARTFPDAERKLHRLAVLRADGEPEIADPYGGTVADFRRCYRVIASALDVALA
jgi:protein-tyrosine-phosphatase/predicted ATP-grasp superfamily ATP-dependent carboligase